MVLSKAYGVSRKKQARQENILRLGQKAPQKKGFRFSRATKWIVSNDPNYEEKKDRILELYNNPPDDGVIVSLDEKGTITVKQYGGSPGWRLLEERIPDRQSIRGRIELSAAYLPHEGIVLRRFSEKKSAHELVELLKSVRAQYSNTKLYVILDNHKMHTSKEFRGFVNGQDGNIELVYTPKHASWLNAIEQIFASIQKWVLDNSSYQSLDQVIGMIEKHLTCLGSRLIELLAIRPFRFALKMMGQMINLGSS